MCAHANFILSLFLLRDNLVDDVSGQVKKKIKRNETRNNLMAKLKFWIVIVTENREMIIEMWSSSVIELELI